MVDGKKKDKLLARVKKLLSEPPGKAKQISVHLIAAVIFLLIFASSYLFIWQPRFETQNLDEEYYELEESGEIIDGNKAYLRKNSDGNYIFYADNIPIEVISKEEVEQGLYDDYPIYEK